MLIRWTGYRVCVCKNVWVQLDIVEDVPPNAPSLRLIVATVKWAYRHQKWNYHHWSDVISADETRFSLQHLNDRGHLNNRAPTSRCADEKLCCIQETWNSPLPQTPPPTSSISYHILRGTHAFFCKGRRFRSFSGLHRTYLGQVKFIHQRHGWPSYHCEPWKDGGHCAEHAPMTKVCDDCHRWSLPIIMMTSSNGNIFRVTGHLCGEFTGPRWISHTKASDAELWCFLWSASE